LSLADTLKFTLAAQSPRSVSVLMFVGQWTLGGSASVTVTLKEQVPALPDGSLAVQVITVSPTGKAEEGALLDVLAIPQLSVSPKPPLMLRAAEHLPGSLLTERSGGQVATGFSVSTTVAVKEQVLELPAKSVALQTLVFVPTGL
jgi:hypothetical protein